MDLKTHPQLTCSEPGHVESKVRQEAASPSTKGSAPASTLRPLDAEIRTKAPPPSVWTGPTKRLLRKRQFEPTLRSDTKPKRGSRTHSRATNQSPATSLTGGRPRTGRAGPLQRSEIWFSQTPGGDRPVLVLTRDPVADRIGAVVVAAITQTIRSLVSGLELTPAGFVPTDCVVDSDNVHTIPRTALQRQIIDSNHPGLLMLAEHFATPQAAQRMRPPDRRMRGTPLPLGIQRTVGWPARSLSRSRSGLSQCD